MTRVASAALMPLAEALGLRSLSGPVAPRPLPVREACGRTAAATAALSQALGRVLARPEEG